MQLSSSINIMKKGLEDRGSEESAWTERKRCGLARPFHRRETEDDSTCVTLSTGQFGVCWLTEKVLFHTLHSFLDPEDVYRFLFSVCSDFVCFGYVWPLLAGIVDVGGGNGSDQKHRQRWPGELHAASRNGRQDALLQRWRRHQTLAE